MSDPLRDLIDADENVSFKEKLSTPNQSNPLRDLIENSDWEDLSTPRLDPLRNAINDNEIKVANSIRNRPADSPTTFQATVATSGPIFGAAPQLQSYQPYTLPTREEVARQDAKSIDFPNLISTVVTAAPKMAYDMSSGLAKMVDTASPKTLLKDAALEVYNNPRGGFTQNLNNVVNKYIDQNAAAAGSFAEGAIENEHEYGQGAENAYRWSANAVPYFLGDEASQKLGGRTTKQAEEANYQDALQDAFDKQTYLPRDQAVNIGGVQVPGRGESRVDRVARTLGSYIADASLGLGASQQTADKINRGAAEFGRNQAANIDPQIQALGNMASPEMVLPIAKAVRASMFAKGLDRAAMLGAKDTAAAVAADTASSAAKVPLRNATLETGKRFMATPVSSTASGIASAGKAAAVGAGNIGKWIEDVAGGAYGDLAAAATTGTIGAMGAGRDNRLAGFILGAALGGGTGHLGRKLGLAEKLASGFDAAKVTADVARRGGGISSRMAYKEATTGAGRKTAAGLGSNRILGGTSKDIFQRGFGSALSKASVAGLRAADEILTGGLVGGVANYFVYPTAESFASGFSQGGAFSAAPRQAINLANAFKPEGSRVDPISQMQFVDSVLAEKTPEERHKIEQLAHNNLDRAEVDAFNKGDVETVKLAQELRKDIRPLLPKAMELEALITSLLPKGMGRPEFRYGDTKEYAKFLADTAEERIRKDFEPKFTGVDLGAPERTKLEAELAGKIAIMRADAIKNTETEGAFEKSTGVSFNDNKQHPVIFINIDKARLATAYHEAGHFLYKYAAQEETIDPETGEKSYGPSGVGSAAMNQAFDEAYPDDDAVSRGISEYEAVMRASGDPDWKAPVYDKQGYSQDEARKWLRDEFLADSFEQMVGISGPVGLRDFAQGILSADDTMLDNMLAGSRGSKIYRDENGEKIKPNRQMARAWAEKMLDALGTAVEVEQTSDGERSVVVPLNTIKAEAKQAQVAVQEAEQRGVREDLVTAQEELKKHLESGHFETTPLSPLEVENSAVKRAKIVNNTPNPTLEQVAAERAQVPTQTFADKKGRRLSPGSDPVIVGSKTRKMREEAVADELIQILQKHDEANIRTGVKDGLPYWRGITYNEPSYAAIMASSKIPSHVKNNIRITQKAERGQPFSGWLYKVYGDSAKKGQPGNELREYRSFRTIGRSVSKASNSLNTVFDTYNFDKSLQKAAQEEFNNRGSNKWMAQFTDGTETSPQEIANKFQKATFQLLENYGLPDGVRKPGAQILGSENKRDAVLGFLGVKDEGLTVGKLPNQFQTNNKNIKSFRDDRLHDLVKSGDPSEGNATMTYGQTLEKQRYSPQQDGQGAANLPQENIDPNKVNATVYTNEEQARAAQDTTTAGEATPAEKTASTIRRIVGSGSKQTSDTGPAPSVLAPERIRSDWIKYLASQPTPPNVSTIDAQAASLGEFAEKEGLMVPLSTITNLPFKHREGAEHRAFMDEAGDRVIKVTTQEQFGIGEATPEEYLRRLERFNEISPKSAVKVIGFSRTGNGGLVVITEQPHVLGNKTSKENLNKKLLENGFVKILTGGDYNYLHPKTGIIIIDAHHGNILLKDNKLNPIDIIAYHINDEMPPAFDAIKAMAQLQMGSKIPPQQKLSEVGLFDTQSPSELNVALPEQSGSSLSNAAISQRTGNEPRGGTSLLGSIPPQSGVTQPGNQGILEEQVSGSPAGEAANGGDGVSLIEPNQLGQASDSIRFSPAARTFLGDIYETAQDWAKAKRFDEWLDVAWNAARDFVDPSDSYRTRLATLRAERNSSAIPNTSQWQEAVKAVKEHFQYADKLPGIEDVAIKIKRPAPVLGGLFGGGSDAARLQRETAAGLTRLPSGALVDARRKEVYLDPEQAMSVIDGDASAKTMQTLLEPLFFLAQTRGAGTQPIEKSIRREALGSLWETALSELHPSDKLAKQQQANVRADIGQGFLMKPVVDRATALAAQYAEPVALEMSEEAPQRLGEEPQLPNEAEVAARAEKALETVSKAQQLGIRKFQFREPGGGVVWVYSTGDGVKASDFRLGKRERLAGGQTHPATEFATIDDAVREMTDAGLVLNDKNIQAKISDAETIRKQLQDEANKQAYIQNVDGLIQSVVAGPGQRRFLFESPEGMAMLIVRNDGGVTVSGMGAPVRLNSVGEAVNALTKHGYQIDANKLKSKAMSGRTSFSDGGEMARFSPAMQSNPDFYSQLERVIEAKMPNKASAQQIRNIIDPAKGSGVKADELKWSGLDEWLQDNPNPTKEEVLNHLRNEGSVRFEEVQLMDLDPNKLWKIRDNKAQENFGMSYHHLNDADTAAIDQEIEDEYQKPEFKQYQIPGGENYREVVLTMPGSDYISSHFESVPNYVAHMRLSEHVDTEGKRGSLSQEYQSDMHQQAREKGYKEEVAPISTDGWKVITIKDNPYTGQRDLEVVDADGKTLSQRSGTRETDEQVVNDLSSYFSKQEGKNKVSDAPYRQSREWGLALFKRQLRDAIAAGLEWVGWTDGQTQADRYDLSKQVRQINYKKNSNGTFALRAEDINGKTFVEDNFTEEKLSDVVGKEVAQKIINGDGASKKTELSNGDVIEMKSLSGLDLKVGGEGMKEFYDKIIPNAVNSYVKKWGAKAEKVDLGIANQDAQEKFDPDTGKRFWPTVEIWRVPITDSMRKSVQEQGQPLFSPKGARTALPAPKMSLGNVALRTEDEEDESKRSGPRPKWLAQQALMEQQALEAGLPQVSNLDQERSDGYLRLLDAITRVEAAGYPVQHFIGTENAPEGDRAPTMDVEKLIQALKLQEAAAPTPAAKAKIAKERAYWENDLATSGMSAEQWKRQTGEDEPDYYETWLTTPEEEAKFQEWKKKYAPNDSGYDYDFRGAFKAGIKPSKVNGHWPDTFKKPNHPTFSNESKYAVGPNAALAGHWDGDTFIPPSPKMRLTMPSKRNGKSKLSEVPLSY